MQTVQQAIQVSQEQERASSRETVKKFPKILKKSFWGPKRALSFEHMTGSKNIYMKVGFNESGVRSDWSRDKFTPVKLEDKEVIDILLVLGRKKDKISFPHTFNNKTTSVHISRGVIKDKKNNDVEGVFFNVNGQFKFISGWEEQILSLVLKHMIVATCEVSI